jgi:hypothetical protein
MQDKKLINLTSGVAQKSGVYSLEFHEDGHFTHVKRANNDGTQDHFPIGASPEGAVAKYENYSDSGNVTYTLPLNTDGAVIFDGNGAFEDRRFSPNWVSHDLYDTTNSKIDLSEVAVGSLIMISYQVKIIPVSSNEQLRLFLRFGTFNNYEMTLFDGAMGKGQNKIHDYVGTKMFFVINEELQQNGVQIMANATCNIEIQPAFLTIALM